MKICPVCKQTFTDDDMFCGDCGVKLVEAQEQAPVQQPVYQQPQYAQPKARPSYDHTAEFTKEDVKSNKVLAIFAYVFGLFGIMVSALVDKGSKYVGFHQRQEMKIMLINIVSFIVGGIVAGIFAGLGAALDAGFLIAIGGIVVGAIAIAQLVVKIIVIIKTLCGKSVEAPLYRIIRFL